MFKRKRISSWDDFVNGVRTVVDREFEQVNTIQTAPLNVTLFASLGSRIPFTILERLAHDRYAGTTTIATERSKEGTRLIVKTDYTNHRKQRKESPASVRLQSPKIFMETTLKLKNEEVIQTVESLVWDVQKTFPTQMNWGCAPYTIIFFKKHKQLIIRFNFSVKTITMDSDATHFKNSWIEYNKKTKAFFLVAIIEDCV